MAISGRSAHRELRLLSLQLRTFGRANAPTSTKRRRPRVGKAGVSLSWRSEWPHTAAMAVVADRGYGVVNRRPTQIKTGGTGRRSGVESLLGFLHEARDVFTKPVVWPVARVRSRLQVVDVLREIIGEIDLRLQTLQRLQGDPE